MNALAFCGVFPIAMFHYIGFIGALFLGVASILFMYAIHRNNPMALEAWVTANQFGYQAGSYRRKTVSFY